MAIVQTGPHYEDLHAVTHAQRAALIVLLAASEYDASPTGYTPRTRVSRDTRCARPWDLAVNAVAVGGLERAGLAVTRIGPTPGTAYADVTLGGAEALEHTPRLRAEVAAVVARLREVQAASDAALAAAPRDGGG
jgi:hypothetical protein